MDFTSCCAIFNHVISAHPGHRVANAAAASRARDFFRPSASDGRGEQIARADRASGAGPVRESTQKRRRHGDRVPYSLCMTAGISGRSDMHSQDAHFQAAGASPRRSADRPNLKEGVRAAKTISFPGFITEKNRKVVKRRRRNVHYFRAWKGSHLSVDRTKKNAPMARERSQ